MNTKLRCVLMQKRRGESKKRDHLKINISAEGSIIQDELLLRDIIALERRKHCDKKKDATRRKNMLFEV